MVLQRYRATQELGKGSFGTVYLTEGRRDKKVYVVKVVDNMRENALKVQEIRIMLHLKHQNIIGMCDFYTSNNQLCIVMEYADGGDLRNEIIKARAANTSISEALISTWMMQVCRALDYAHAEQIIHRDIKPSNIFLMADGRSVKVGDFGIAKVLDTPISKDQSVAPDPDGRVGTKRYMAPEVLNRKEYSNKADVWSLGCVMFELMSLQHPTYEQLGRLSFEWIPDNYSIHLMDALRACVVEDPKLRSSTREIAAQLTVPYKNSPQMLQFIQDSATWYNNRLEDQRRAFEEQMFSVGQFASSERLSASTASISPVTITSQLGMTQPEANRQIPNVQNMQVGAQSTHPKMTVPERSLQMHPDSTHDPINVAASANQTPGELSQSYPLDLRRSFQSDIENRTYQRVASQERMNIQQTIGSQGVQTRSHQSKLGPSSPAAAISLGQAENYAMRLVPSNHSAPPMQRPSAAPSQDTSSFRNQYSSFMGYRNVSTGHVQGNDPIRFQINTVNDMMSFQDSQDTLNGERLSEEEMYSDYDLIVATNQQLYNSRSGNLNNSHLAMRPNFPIENSRQSYPDHLVLHTNGTVHLSASTRSEISQAQDNDVNQQHIRRRSAGDTMNGAITAKNFRNAIVQEDAGTFDSPSEPSHNFDVMRASANDLMNDQMRHRTALFTQQNARVHDINSHRPREDVSQESKNSHSDALENGSSGNMLPLHNGRMPEPQQAEPNDKQSNSVSSNKTGMNETLRVIEELERIRSGIRETLAAAGKQSSITSSAASEGPTMLRPQASTSLSQAGRANPIVNSSTPSPAARLPIQSKIDSGSNKQIFAEL